jgi:SAM-dependent methyltransferase
MSGASEERLRTSFGAAAAAYAEHRPDYAEDAVRWVLDAAPATRVLDLGAGTGKLTAVLARLGTDVVAVEPDPAMLAELRRGLPHVRALAGSAESIPLPDGSVDAVVAGHAMHWFDMAVAGPEIARVLAPGGVLAGLWNVMDDGVDWVSGLAEVGGEAAVGPRDLLGRWEAATASTYLPHDGSGPTFGHPERATFTHPLPHTTDSLVAKIGTHAGILVLPDVERGDLLGRIRAHLDAHPATSVGAFELPVLTAVLRVHQV